MSAAPSAINMIVICTLKEAYMESISMMMMVMYGIAMITMTLGVTVIIGIIGYLNNVNITVSHIKHVYMFYYKCVIKQLNNVNRPK